MPETDTVATLVLLEVAVIAPSPALVTVMVVAEVLLFRVMLVLFSDKLPAALPIFQATVLAPVPPSLH